MTLLEQCQKWHEDDQHEKIIEAILALPPEEQNAGTDLELARAYNNLADPQTEEGQEMLWQAAALLRLHEEELQDDYAWNFRLGYALFFLRHEEQALSLFERALSLHPGDNPQINSREEIEDLIEMCRGSLALPHFAESFCRRTEKFWQAFLREEAKLRRLMDESGRSGSGEKMLKKCEKLLGLISDSISFELGHNGEKYELVLTAEGDKAKLFELAYIGRRVPEKLLENWSILIGRRPAGDIMLAADNLEIGAADVRVLVEEIEEGGLALTFYCEKLVFLLKNEENSVWWMLTTLTDQVLGEIAALAYIESFDVVTRPDEKQADASRWVLLSELPQTLEKMGYELSLSAEDLLESYVVYHTDPIDDPQADWRLDVVAGVTRLEPLVKEYLAAEHDSVDMLYADGIATGFFSYPLDGFDEGDSEAILDFRDRLIDELMNAVGEDVMTITGSATGLHYGYIDFVAWDLEAVLYAALGCFENSGLGFVDFHTFRRDVGGVRLYSGQEEEPPAEVDPETGSLLSAADIVKLESFEDDEGGYFGQMLDYIQDFIMRGIAEERFTEQQARQDLVLALWYAYACNNINDYDHYYEAIRWMPASEKNAAGCGTWYQRYSVALMYCGRLEEAARYAELGASEEPSYPWVWLQVGKLRAHFGDKRGALEAVARGLALVPGDHEFETLRSEIWQDAGLEQMLYHWIDPEKDRLLQEGKDESAAAKKQAISCILVDEEGLERFRRIFGPGLESYSKNNPYCGFIYHIGEKKISVVFRMNEAGLSKLDPAWLRRQKERLDSGCWLRGASKDGACGTLDSVAFCLDYSVVLIYQRDDAPADAEGKDASPEDAEEFFYLTPAED